GYEKTKNLHSWLDAFHTRLFGHIQDSHEAEFLTGRTHFEFKDLIPGAQFVMREGNNWLPFWLPKPD
ncbi:MAG TPA: hypothetical protein VHM28_06270, partial [Anaerolineales bacterium]|nr:hypothetical protein [Anaerolineales bacterium]